MKVNYLVYTYDEGLVFVSEHLEPCRTVIKDFKRSCFVKSLRTGKWSYVLRISGVWGKFSPWALSHYFDEEFKISEFDPKEFKDFTPFDTGFGFGIYTMKI